MSKYLNYTDAQEAVWFKSLPDTWQAIKMRELFSERSTVVSDKDYAPLSVGYMGVVPQLENAAKTDNGDNRKLIKTGDFAINSRSDRKGAGGISKYDGSCSMIITVLKPHNAINGNFYHYLLRSHYFSEEFYRNGYGIVDDLWTTKWKTMRNIYLPVPPRAEQDKIVRYLDWQVSKVNKLISVKRKEIATLKELRFYIVSQAVMKGVEYQTVSNEEQFERVKIGYRSWIRARLGWRGLKASEYVESGYPFLSAFNIINDKLCWANLNFINQMRFDESPEIKLSVGDVLLVKDGAGIGKCARIDELPFGPASPNGSLAVITPDAGFDYRYFYYYLISNDFKNATNKIITGMGVPHLTQHFLKNVEVPCPPKEVQTQIADFLDEQSKTIDSIISSKEHSINGLHALKDRIVADAVTGQIDVRDVVIPNYEYVEEQSDEDTDEESGGDDTEEQEE